MYALDSLRDISLNLDAAILIFDEDDMHCNLETMLFLEFDLFFFTIG